jgi:hypothetical protein
MRDVGLCEPAAVDGRQLVAVLTGIVLFMAGAIVGLTPLRVPLGQEQAAVTVPLLDPGAAVDRQPDRLVLSGSLMLLGVAVAAAGWHTGRQRSRAGWAGRDPAGVQLPHEREDAGGQRTAPAPRRTGAVPRPH